MSKELCEIANLFTGHTAWFSSSVLPKTRGLWLALGGTECSLETADFVFSADVNTPDTACQYLFSLPLRCMLHPVVFTSHLALFLLPNKITTVHIFMDVSYCKNGIAVIHPTYINACIIAENIMDVTLGDYILYPESIQHFIKQQRLKNTCPAKIRQNSSAMRNKSLHSDQKTEAKRKADIEKKKSITPQTSLAQPQEREGDAVHISDMELISGDLHDFIPGKNKCLVYHL